MFESLFLSNFVLRKGGFQDVVESSNTTWNTKRLTISDELQLPLQKTHLKIKEYA